MFEENYCRQSGRGQVLGHHGKMAYNTATKQASKTRNTEQDAAKSNI